MLAGCLPPPLIWMLKSSMSISSPIPVGSGPANAGSEACTQDARELTLRPWTIGHFPQRPSRLERVRTADGRPAIYSVDYLPRSIVGPDLGKGRLGRSIYQLLADLGYAVHHGEAAVQPAVADDHVAKVMGCRVGTLLQRLDQVDFDEGERA